MARKFRFNNAHRTFCHEYFVQVRVAAPFGEPGPPRNNLTEFIIRAQRIFPRNESLVEQAVKEHFGFHFSFVIESVALGYPEASIRQHIEWLSANPKEVSLSSHCGDSLLIGRRGCGASVESG